MKTLHPTDATPIVRSIDAQLVEQLGDEAVDDAVAAARAVVGGAVGQGGRAEVDRPPRGGYRNRHVLTASRSRDAHAPSSIRLSGSASATTASADGRRAAGGERSPGAPERVHDVARGWDHAAHPAVVEHRASALDREPDILDQLARRQLDDEDRPQALGPSARARRPGTARG